MAAADKRKLTIPAAVMRKDPPIALVDVKEKKNPMILVAVAMLQSLPMVSVDAIMLRNPPAIPGDVETAEETIPGTPITAVQLILPVTVGKEKPMIIPVMVADRKTEITIEEGFSLLFLLPDTPVDVKKSLCNTGFFS